MTKADWDSMLGVLANEYRRRLLVSLLVHNPQGDMIEAPGEERNGDTEAVRAELYHQHLPKLDESGYVEWNRDAHEVVKGPKFDEIRPLLELVQDHADDLPDGWT